MITEKKPQLGETSISLLAAPIGTAGRYNGQSFADEGKMSDRTAGKPLKPYPTGEENRSRRGRTPKNNSIAWSLSLSLQMSRDFRFVLDSEQHLFDILTRHQ
jgi:hypothetical protein